MLNIVRKLSATAIMLVVLSACATTTPGANGTVGQIQRGSVDDPASIAYFQQTLGDRVLFAVNESTLSSDAADILNGQANWLLQNTQYSVTVEGHADERGTREYNLALGARRASSVRDYLVERGVADNRVKTVTYGKQRPIAVCSAEECWSQNRRAVTVVNAGLGS
ncbi:MAG: peptidoglycan-associated lipoprotein Pal [Rhodobacterales bacterium]